LTFDPGDGGRYAFGPPPDCGANASPTYEVRESGSAGVSCADGTGGDWAFDTGEPLPGNSARFTDPLPQYPAAYSWDGYLLVRFTAVEQTPTPTPS